MEVGIVGHGSVDVFIDVDVGKGEHHAVALDRPGKRVSDKALPNDEHRLRELIRGLKDRERCCSWRINPPRSARCRSSSRETRVRRLATCPQAQLFWDTE
jgi:hypothetical protein